MQASVNGKITNISLPKPNAQNPRAYVTVMDFDAGYPLNVSTSPDVAHSLQSVVDKLGVITLELKPRDYGDRTFFDAPRIAFKAA